MMVFPTQDGTSGSFTHYRTSVSFTPYARARCRSRRINDLTCGRAFTRYAVRIGSPS